MAFIKFYITPKSDCPKNLTNFYSNKWWKTHSINSKRLLLQWSVEKLINCQGSLINQILQFLSYLKSTLAYLSRCRFGHVLSRSATCWRGWPLWQLKLTLLLRLTGLFICHHHLAYDLLGWWSWPIMTLRRGSMEGNSFVIWRLRLITI